MTEPREPDSTEVPRDASGEWIALDDVDPTAGDGTFEVDDEGWDFVSEPVERPAPKPANADDWNFGDVPDPVPVPAKTADEWSF